MKSGVFFQALNTPKLVFWPGKGGEKPVLEYLELEKTEKLEKTLPQTPLEELTILSQIP